jgi:multiple sugar transport system substrate-binding protein
LQILMRQCQKIQWEAADEFNRRQHVYQVKLVSSIRRDYESWVQLEAAIGILPCLLEFDGPHLAELAWLQYLQPIGRLVTPEFLHDFLPSIIAQGTYQGRL